MILENNEWILAIRKALIILMNNIILNNIQDFIINIFLILWEIKIESKINIWSLICLKLRSRSILLSIFINLITLYVTFMHAKYEFLIVLLLELYILLNLCTKYFFILVIRKIKRILLDLLYFFLFIIVVCKFLLRCLIILLFYTLLFRFFNSLFELLIFILLNSLYLKVGLLSRFWLLLLLNQLL